LRPRSPRTGPQCPPFSPFTFLRCFWTSLPTVFLFLPPVVSYFLPPRLSSSCSRGYESDPPASTPPLALEFFRGCHCPWGFSSVPSFLPYFFAAFSFFDPQNKAKQGGPTPLESFFSELSSLFPKFLCLSARMTPLNVRGFPMDLPVPLGFFFAVSSSPKDPS